VIQDKKQAVLVVDVEKIGEAKRVLKEEGLMTLTDQEIYSL
jgi:hypothetical protein